MMAYLHSRKCFQDNTRGVVANNIFVSVLGNIAAQPARGGGGEVGEERKEEGQAGQTEALGRGHSVCVLPATCGSRPTRERGSRDRLQLAKTQPRTQQNVHTPTPASASPSH